MTDEWLSERIRRICYRLEHMHFSSSAEKNKLLQELQQLIERRTSSERHCKNKMTKEYKKKENRMIETQTTAQQGSFNSYQKDEHKDERRHKPFNKKPNRPNFVKDGDDRVSYRREENMIRTGRPKAVYAKCVCGGTMKPRGSIGVAGGYRSKCNKCGKTQHGRSYKGTAGLAKCY